LTYHDHQARVDSYFDARSSDWAEIYSTRTVHGVIHQRRMAVVLEWIDDLALPKGSRILEIGCGAGFTAVELGRRGYTIDAMDSSETMVERARRNAIESEVDDRVRVFRGDVNSLPFGGELFDLVIAMGVLPWLASLETPVREMARVLRPNGYVIFSSDNLLRLNYLMDPRRNPALAPLKRLLKHALERARIRKSRKAPQLVHMHTTWHIDRVVSESRLQTEKAITLGFGPFSFLGRTLLPDPAGIRWHHRLQTLADRGVPGVRSTGSQYLVLAKKP
jgi:ubiquinone/menaquinone biosynthesis C-methylase UbiE